MCRTSILLVTILLFAHPSAAQTTASGSVRGVARDQQGAVVPGVMVTAASPTVPGIYTSVTDRAGAYRLGDLPPGDYTIVGELTGFARFRRTPVAVRAGLNFDVDLTMTIGAIDEVVDVRQETPLLESRNAAQAINVSGDLQRAMPLSERREWTGALTLAPGVATSEWVNSERLFYVNGADSSSNVVQIDGADVTPSAGSATRFIGLSTDAIDDMQIKTAGIDASAPLGVGGIVNIASASGTNQIKGAATLFLQPRAWNDSNTLGGTSSTVDQRQLDASIGGPIVRDRLWAFATYRYTDVVSGVSRTAAQLEAMRLLVPGFVPFDSTNESQFWFAKVNAQPSVRQQAQAFYQYDVNPATTADAVTEHVRTDANGGSGASVRLSSAWSDRLTTRISASYNDKRRDGRPPEGSGPLQRVYQSTLLSAGRLLGNGRLADRGTAVTAWNEQPNSKLTLSFDATLFATPRFGSHELQSGVYLQPRTRTGLRTFWVNGGYVFEEAVLRAAGSADVVPFHRILIDGTEFTNSRRVGQDYAWYVQDAWRPTGRLTINAGVRIDYITWKDELFDITTQRSTDVGPRAGANYAVTADGRNIVRAHWVRVHDAASRTGTSVGSSSLAQRDIYDLDLNGTFETEFFTPATFGLTPNRTIDPDLHQPFVDEWGAGYSRQLAGNVAVNVTALQREYRDRTTLLETNGRYSGRMFVGYVDESTNDVFQVTNNRWNRPIYRSAELSVTKRSARVHGLASYVRQWRHLAGTWQPNDPASFIQPEAFGNGRGIGNPNGSLTTAEANSLSGSSMTQRATASAQWQDHVVRLGAVYQGPWSIVLATNYTFQSGAWSGPIVTRIAAADPAFGPATITLSNGRRVSNPLATVVRFAFPTRGDGQLTTPPLHAWNLRAGRAMTWRGVKIEAALDIFNITNNGADASFETGANQTFSPAYGVTTFRQLPRSAQLVLRGSF